MKEIKEFTPEALSLLEDKEGHILRSEEATKRAWAEKSFHEAALTPGLSSEAKAILLKQAEKASENAGQQWRKEHEVKLLEEYEARIKEIMEKELIGDEVVAQAMAGAEKPYRLAAGIEGISEKDKDVLLKQAEPAAEKEFLVSTPRRLEDLKEELKKADGECKEREDEYKKLCSEIKEPRTSLTHYEKRGTEYEEVVPKWLAEENMKSERKNKEEFYKHQKRELETIRYGGSYSLPTKERAEDARTRMKKLINDWEEMLPKFENAIKREESILNTFQTTQELEEKQLESLRKPTVFGKKEYGSKRKQIEESLEGTKNSIRYYSKLINNYKEYTIEPAQKLINIFPRFDELLTESNTARGKEEEIMKNILGLEKKLKEAAKIKESA